MFKSRPDHHQLNIRQSASFNARPGILTTPTGGEEPAVVIRSNGAIHGVFPLPEALRLANEIADSLAAHRGRKA